MISSTGNTTCAQVLRANVPWIVVPEWRYFDEQVLKARMLAQAGAAYHWPALPSSAHRWRETVAAARAGHDPACQARLAGGDGAAHAADWLETLAGPPLALCALSHLNRGPDPCLRFPP